MCTRQTERVQVFGPPQFFFLFFFHWRTDGGRLDPVCRAVFFAHYSYRGTPLTRKRGPAQREKGRRHPGRCRRLRLRASSSSLRPSDDHSRTRSRPRRTAHARRSSAFLRARPPQSVIPRRIDDHNDDNKNTREKNRFAVFVIAQSHQTVAEPSFRTYARRTRSVPLPPRDAVTPEPTPNPDAITR